MSFADLFRVFGSNFAAIALAFFCTYLISHALTQKIMFFFVLSAGFAVNASCYWLCGNFSYLSALDGVVASVWLGGFIPTSFALFGSFFLVYIAPRKWGSFFMSR